MLKFSSEENGKMLVVWTYDKDRNGDCWETGLGIEGEESSSLAISDIFLSWILHLKS